MEPNTLIYALNEFKVTYPKVIHIIDASFVNNHTFSIIKFQGLALQGIYLLLRIFFLHVL